MLQDLINAAVLGSIYTLFALGMSLTWGTLGILNFAHGSIFMFSSFVAYLAVREVALPLPVLLLIGAAAGAVLSVVLDRLLFQPIQRRNHDHRIAELQILIGGIGIAGIPIALAQRATDNTSFGLHQSSYGPTTYRFAGVHITTTQIFILVACLVLAAGVGLWISRSQSGLALRSIGVDAETASLMGVARRSLSTLTMALAGALAGTAGVLLTFYLGALAPESGDHFLIKAFAAIILGGVGSTLGAVVGSFVLAACETLVITQTSGTWVDAVSFGLILVMLLVRPQGLFGKREVRRA
jgi:branched-chain amino acid transport system permease protein